MVVCFIAMWNATIKNRRLLYPALAVTSTCIAILVGWIGIDFGHHWDEHFHLRYEIMRWLPGDYGYPSMTYNISHLSTALHLTSKAIQYRYEQGERWREKYNAYTTDAKARHFIKLRSRLTCLIISQLTTIGIFLIVSNTWNKAEACLACVLLNFSNEFLYHSRWIAPDTLMAFWATLTIAVVLRALSKNSIKLLYIAAVLAGCTISTKYTNVFIIFSLMAACLMLFPNKTPRAVMHCLGVNITALAAFMATSPGIILERAKFWPTLLPVFRDYTMGHGGATVRAGLPHLLKSLLYLSTQFFSSIMIINIVFFALCILGCISWAYKKNKEMVVISLYLILYLIFVFSHIVMLVRNLMVLFPFMAIFLARGIVLVHGKLPSRGRIFFSLFIFISIAVTLFGEARDALTIDRYASDPQYGPRMALEYIREDSKHLYYIHPNIRADLMGQGRLPENITEDPRGADFVIAYPPIFPNDIENSPFVFKRWFGTREVNYRYYSTWQWDVYLMDKDKFNPVILTPSDAKRYNVLGST